MKSMLMPFIIFILVGAAIVFGFFVFNTTYGEEFEEGITEIKILDLTQNMVEAFKAYSQLSLAYSSQEAFRESACKGGLISDEIWPWICNGMPNIPSIESIKSCTSKFTKYFLTIYLDNFSVELPLEIYKEAPDKCEVEVDYIGVITGKYDEGNFWIKCENVKVSFKGKNLSVSDKFNISYFLINNRFWYMYRKIAEWATENYYTNCICSATFNCLSCSDTDKCAKEALQKLKEKFENDENVSCKWEKNSKCCNTEIGDSCLEEKKCIAWCNKCCVNCMPACIKETEWDKVYLGLCIPSNLVYFKQKNSESNKNVFYFSPDEMCRIWNEYRLERSDVFICTDHAYYIPSESGPVPLVFTIRVQAGFRVEHPACERLVPCDEPNYDCPQGYRKCVYKVCENGMCVEKTKKICNAPCPQDECKNDDECGKPRDE